ncbi:hypothetical protein FC75_GL000931 [Lacticaseibacillus camelliae DSM 22697 = JCM 13995]|uniref:Integral membrane protein n=1 Tax=Lacticaseibacillus camelliae DSM 22697 = JCM 13995 TaxID=1423730 RepID=A0A0R2FD26_9LACO|nr:hypothetical protein FC75_GL000931 [Lacticaseibacillus camelliae DSM 22697 = JCM 13995]
MTKNVLARTGLYALVALIAAGIAIIGLKLNGIAPFGPHTILRMDMNQQYVSYFSYLKRNFGDWQHFLYSNNMTLGGNMFGLMTYYLMSPFNIIIFMFPYSQLPIALAWIAVAKNAAASVSMLVLVRYFIRRYQLQVGVPLQILLAISWGFSGWMLHFSMDLMWQDTVILLPLVVLGVERYIEHTRWAFYAVMLGLSLIINYYIGYMVALFLVHYFILRMVIEWRIHNWTFKRIMLKLGYFGAISLVTVGLAWVVIWPTLKTLQGVKGTHPYHFNFNNSWVLDRLFNNFFNMTYTKYSWNASAPMIYTGVIVMGLLLAFLCAKQIPGVIRAATAGILLLLIAESYFDGTNAAWHGFNEPIGFLQRWSFVFSFLFILIALFVLGMMRLSKVATRRVFLVTVLIGVMVAFRQLRIFGKMGDYGSNQFTSLTFTYNVGAMIAAALALTLYFSFPKWRRVTGLLVAVIGLSDLAVATVWSYGHQQPYFNMARYSTEVRHTNAAVAWIQKHDSSDFYRMELNYQRSRSDPMEFGFNGLTHFSSSQPRAIDYLMQEMGYLHSSPWTSYNGGSTRAADDFFGIRYLVEGPSGVTNRGSKLVTQGLKKLKTLNGYTIYENPAAQHMGVVAPDKTTRKPSWSTYLYMANAYNISYVYRDITGIKGLYLNRGGVKETERNLKSRTVAFTIPGGGMNHPLYLQLVTDSLYTLLPESDPDIDVYVDGRRVTTDGTENENAVIPLGAFPVNQTLKVQLKVHDFTMVEKKKAHKKITHLPKYNVNVGYGEVFKAVQKKMATQPVAMHRLTTTHWDGSVTAAAAHQSLIMTLPYDTGWQVTVDGKPVKAHKYLEMMKINLNSAGKHHVDLVYDFPQLRQGLKVSLAAGVGLIILLIVQAFTVWGWRIRNRRLERVAAANAPLFDPHHFDYR